MTGAQAHITLMNDRMEIERLHESLQEYFTRFHIPPDVHFVIMLALDELLTNIISYAYPDTREHPIDIFLASDNWSIIIEISDDGTPFNPLEVEEPDLTVSIEERQIGGLGVHLVRKLMDSVEYQRHDDRNIFTMKKTLHATPAAD